MCFICSTLTSNTLFLAAIENEEISHKRADIWLTTSDFFSTLCANTLPSSSPPLWHSTGWLGYRKRGLSLTCSCFVIEPWSRVGFCCAVGSWRVDGCRRVGRGSWSRVSDRGGPGGGVEALMFAWRERRCRSLSTGSFSSSLWCRLGSKSMDTTAVVKWK